MIAVVGHRGAPRVHRENTLDSFKAALELGADGIELDVRRTRDGALVVHHDPAVPGFEALSNLRRADLPAWLPELDEALDVCAGHVVHVEVKNLPHEPGWDPAETAARETARLLEQRGQLDRTAISSFSLAAIEAAREAVPGVRTGWLTMPAYDQLDAVAEAARRGHGAVHPHDQATTPMVVDAAHEAGLQVVVWTVDDPARMRALAAMGVDAIITNVPDVAVAALSRWR